MYGHPIFMNRVWFVSGLASLTTTVKERSKGTTRRRLKTGPGGFHFEGDSETASLVRVSTNFTALRAIEDDFEQ